MTNGSAAHVVQRLTRLGHTIAAAESITGGLVLATLVGVPGASAVIRGGVVVYATELKATLGGVDPDLLARVGPVSARVAQALAVGVRRSTGSTWGVATTGVAGPDRQDGHPVGTVYVGLSGPTATQVRRLALAGSRQEIRDATVSAVFDLILAAASPG